ncbi:hypothetical protein MMAD_32200 [Mycolicibacterium madagascariense]|uniref:DUF732 domain-containing protein n=1 Tax=Mycolicibacterium madagascariense TaxID=212765 RepID=A0A7I7XIL2_9MYCO|nr:hypothetical protein MMAD_32200 [Mycolicibacterium madagascariense]
MRHTNFARVGIRTCAITTTIIGTLAAVGLGLASTATAASTDTGNAQDTISSLHTQGFDVRINGSADDPISECTVTDVHGMSDSNVDSSGQLIDDTHFTTVYVDISCPDDH